MPTDDNQRATSPADSAPTTLDSPNQGATSQKDLKGQVLNGRYVIESELKRGGMGVVYIARDQQLHSRNVVVKVLLEDAYQSEYVVQKFRQEVEALSRIDHPGIVGIIDAGELGDGKPFIVMQYVEGVTLRSVITPEGVNLERTADILKQTSRALAAAHSRGIFHRDLKPDNIMMQNLGAGDEQVKIIDFGIAKVKDSVIAPSTSLNLSPGTVAYMAPEQLSGRPITAATDVFALGAIAYEMVTGRKPYNPETGYELLQMQQTGVRVKPADLRPSLPLAAQEVILKALSFNPSERQRDPREFGDSLARAISEGPTTSPPQVKQTSALPVTELSDEETPVAKPRAGSPAPTIQVPFQAAQPINPSAADLGLVDGSRPAHRSGRKGVVFGAILLFLILAVGGAWLLLRPKTVAVEDTAPNIPERNLSYALTVQKMRGGQPYQQTFESSGQEIFESGWKFRMNISSPQSGNLYLLNEGPSSGGKTTYNVLFPAPSSNSGSQYVAANRKIETGWMVFDENQGTEKFWIVWADKPVPELEAVKGVVNEKDKGNISDSGQSTAVRTFLLANHASSKPEIEKDKGNKKSNVKGKGQSLVTLIELEHH